LQDPTLTRNAPILDDQWLGVLLETGLVGFGAMLWLFFRVIRRAGSAAKADYTPRGWLLAGICSSVAAFMVGMITFDAFAFVQVTFLVATLIGLASALLVGSNDAEASDSARASIDHRRGVPSPAGIRARAE
jgi:O-antigen ligase